MHQSKIYGGFCLKHTNKKCGMLMSSSKKYTSLIVATISVLTAQGYMAAFQVIVTMPPLSWTT